MKSLQIRFFGALLFSVLILNCKSSKESSTIKKEIQKPLNVVLILMDDQGYDTSIDGMAGIETPNFDAFSKEGIRFTNAYAVVPSCSPSRSSIATGMYPHTNGHWRNTITPSLSDGDEAFGRQATRVDKVGIHEYIKTLPEVLQENGFFTAITQKFHMSPPWKFPFSDRDPVHNNPAVYKKVITEFIEKSGDKPFFFQANISPPHRNFDAHMKKFPEFMPNPEEIVVPDYLPDTPMMREDLSKYYGCVQLADACAGAIIEALKKAGEFENTLIIYTSDQGQPYHRAKASAYSEGLHVPYAVVGPNVIKDKISNALISHTDIMPTILDFLNLPIPSTIQGKSLLPVLNGSKEKVTDRKYIFGEHNSHGPDPREHYPSRVVFDGRFYFIKNLMPNKSYLLPADLRAYKGWSNKSYDATVLAKDTHPMQYNLLRTLEKGRPAEELYDMQNDTYQLINLANNPEYKEKKIELRQALKNWRKETGDVANNPKNIKTRQLN
ncbi:sulfatase [Polaribacter aestuariivivens]|uniref:Sulfatase n=1 Tax=Polaribacter aestuariivivens TaxID=2304626 RepID=A0A5S3N5G8_9FLAO|nr:sulfatase [Polaribacter aestuariivivens]TMM30628.1 sulfatase [Polaribacter aestuariivivens]